VTGLDPAAILCQGRRVALFLNAELHPDHNVIITVSGVAAYQSPDQIPGAVRAAIVRWAPRAVLLDVADVSLFDAGIIAALLAGHQTGAWADIPVTLFNVGALPLSQLRESGLASVLCPDLVDPIPAPDGSPAGMLAR
jgi:hypothetical protein